MSNTTTPSPCIVARNLTDLFKDINEGAKDVFMDVLLQTHYLSLKESECRCKMKTDPVELTGVYCPRVWDDIMCWDDTPAGSTVAKPCAFYINKFTTHGLAHRVCLPNGTWYSEDDNSTDMGRKGWTNFSECLNEAGPRPTMEVPSLIKDHLTEFRLMYNVGYGLSLVFLVFAMIIMIYFKKLHCSRNTIHMNLFVSFIFRAFMNLIRDNFLVAGVGFPNDLVFNDSGGIVSFKEGPHWECRLFFSLFQYAVAASYIWIFVEAVYIHMLIFVSVFTERIRVIWFMLFGWSIPFVFVLIWSIARLTLDNSLCWNTTENKPGITWILKGPIMLTVVINFFFFISLVWILYTKLSASPEVRRSKYRTLARSTLFLIPAFGVYYIVFTIPLEGQHDTIVSVMLFIEMFFNSYQGVFIAVILCFINAEVRAEIRKFWVQRQLRRGSTTSTVVRCSKMKFKRETVVPCESTDFEMPVVVVENGHVVPRKLNEEMPFLDINSRNGNCVTTRLYNNLQPATENDTESLTLINNGATLLHENSSDTAEQIKKDIENVALEVVGESKSKGCDNVDKKSPNGGRLGWKEARISWSDKS